MDAIMALICAGSYGRTSIDQVCERAGVKKGSFYYFFNSKAELAAAALDAEFQEDRQELDATFSTRIPPLDRIRIMNRNAYEWQLDLQRKYGRVLGCSLHCLGAEISLEEPLLCAKIQEIMGHYQNYLASAIRDAHEQGLISAPDPAAKAQMLFAYYEGLLTQARIKNDVELLREMESGTMSLLGVRPD